MGSISTEDTTNVLIGQTLTGISSAMVIVAAISEAITEFRKLNGIGEQDKVNTILIYRKLITFETAGFFFGPLSAFTLDVVLKVDYQNLVSIQIGLLALQCLIFFMTNGKLSMFKKSISSDEF